MCCNITVRSNIVITTSSFSFNLSENPASNCALFVNKFAVKLKWKKDQVLTDMVWIFIKNKVNLIVPNAGIRSKAMQRLFFHNLALHSALLSLEIYLSFGFCVDLCSPLSSFTYYMLNRWAGLNRQCCRSRCWWSSAEAVFSHTITS